MANTSKPITLGCPQCSHDGVRAVVSSYSIITVACVRCSHQWTVAIASLPDDVRKQIPYVEGREEQAKRSA